MDDNVSKSLHLGFNTYITILLIVVSLSIFFKGKALLNLVNKNTDQVTADVNKSNFTKYDNTTVNGSEVINAISLNATDKFSITVQTKANPSGITYNSPSGYNIKDLSDANYIEPTANFTSQIVKNTNKSVVKILFTQATSLPSTSMTNNTGKGIVITPSSLDQAVPEGYTDGNMNSIKVLGDPNLIPSNIVSGVTIFGTTGNGGRKVKSGTVAQTTHITVSGLGFKPSIIICWLSTRPAQTTGLPATVNYNSYYSTSYYEDTNYTRYLDGATNYVNNDGFSLTVGNWADNWVAIQ